MSYYPVLPQFLTFVLHFQWEGPNDTNKARGPIVAWQLMANMTRLGGRCMPRRFFGLDDKVIGMLPRIISHINSRRSHRLHNLTVLFSTSSTCNFRRLCWRRLSPLNVRGGFSGAEPAYAPSLPQSACRNGFHNVFGN